MNQGVVEKIPCPACRCPWSLVVPVNNPNLRVTRDGAIRRWRQCRKCHVRYSTLERYEQLVADPKKSPTSS